MKDEDVAFEQWRQRQIERDWDNLPPRMTGQFHQKVGTVIPFRRTVDRGPNSRIPLSVPVPYVKISKREALFWFVLVLVWIGCLFFGSGER